MVVAVEEIVTMAAVLQQVELGVLGGQGQEAVEQFLWPRLHYQTVERLDQMVRPDLTDRMALALVVVVAAAGVVVLAEQSG